MVALLAIRDAHLDWSNITTLLVQELDVLVDVHPFRLLDVEKELLCVASNLRSRPGHDVALDSLPIFAVKFEGYKRYG